jgi:hypothetical protein
MLFIIMLVVGNLDANIGGYFNFYNILCECYFYNIISG